MSLLCPFQLKKPISDFAFLAKIRSENLTVSLDTARILRRDFSSKMLRHRSAFSVGMGINNFFIKISCRKIGSDEFGNEYFQNKNGRRFVAYNGIAEPSKIPAEWHGWIHHSTDLAPIKISTRKFSWQRIHLSNLTGTKGAYSPKNSATKKVVGFYEAWKI